MSYSRDGGIFLFDTAVDCGQALMSYSNTKGNPLERMAVDCGQALMSYSALDPDLGQPPLWIAGRR